MTNFVGTAVDKLLEKVADSGLKACKNYIDLESNLKSLKRKWEALEGRASDIGEEVSRAELSGKKKRKKEVDNWLKQVEKINTEFPKLEELVREGLLRNLLTGGEVKKMEERVEELKEQSQHFNELVLDDHGNRGRPRLITKLFGEMFEKNLESICQCLVIDGISNIGIYGMGGVGKTTLAKHIHNYLLKKTNFRVCWVTFSQEFDLKKRQEKVAKFIGLDLSDEEDGEIRADMLYEILEKSKNLVLILDDVWEDSVLKRVGIPPGVNGCKVILTTRLSQLCDRMDCQRKFVVNTLYIDEAWELFKYTLGQGTVLNAEIEEIAKSMTERCDRLPLGIITMAGSMKGVNDIRHWRDALEQLKSYSKGNSEMDCKVFSGLEWSFNRLSESQQNCFLYCSLYPEDDEIPREKLISLFISAGLLDRRQTRKQEFDQGHKILNELVSACLLEETINVFVAGVKMHDLIRDMAIRITNGEYLATIPRDKPRFLVRAGVRLNEMPEQKEWAKDLDVVSLMDNRISEIAPDMSPNCPKLSIFLLRGNHHLRWIPSSFFAHMITSLWVLDLSHTGIEELPNCISDMENLTALLLGQCEYLLFVPPLGKLRELRQLDIGDTACQNIPEGLEMLVNLRCLYMDRAKIERIPEGTLARLSRLQCLMLPESCSIQLTDAKALKELEEFKGQFCSVDAYNQLLRSQQNHCRLNSYYIVVGETKKADEIGYTGELERGNGLILRNCSIGDGEDVESDVILLPQNIKRLEVDSCFGKGSCLSDIFPQWNASIDLVECRISRSFEQSEFLLSVSSTSDEKKSRCSPLQSLEKLYLKGLPNLIGLIKWGESGVRRCLPDGTLSNLRSLEIEECHKITKLFTPQLVKNLQNLQWLRVNRCDKLEEIIAESKFPFSVSSTSDEKESRCSPLQSLEELYLEGLPNLVGLIKWGESGVRRCLPDGTLSNLRKLDINGCHKITKLFAPQLVKNLQRLQYLSVFACDKLEEIIAEDEMEGLELITAVLPNLEILYLYGLRELKSICKGSTISDTIIAIEVFGCPKLKRLPLSIPATDLVTSDEKESRCSPLQSLEELYLGGLPNLIGLIKWGEPGARRCLPNGTLSNLRTLHIDGCHKITKLFTPQLVKNLQMLQFLSVIACDKLEEIIAEDEMEGQELITVVLPKLQSFSLSGLPELKSICKGSTISDSILYIDVSGCPKLKRLPLSIPTIDGQLSCPKNHWKIYGEKEWWESLEWDSPSAKIALQSKFKLYSTA